MKLEPKCWQGYLGVPLDTISTLVVTPTILSGQDLYMLWDQTLCLLQTIVSLVRERKRHIGLALLHRYNPIHPEPKRFERLSSIRRVRREKAIKEETITQTQGTH